MSAAIAGVTFDAHDAHAAATFWARALGGTVAAPADAQNTWINPDPDTPGSLRIGFQRVTEGRTGKNRLHLHLVTTDLDAEVRRLVGLGATRNDTTEPGAPWVTLLDPEGNIFDVAGC